MDRGTFKRYLRRGHGRALLWFESHPTAEFDDVIVDACVVDTRLDAQCEDSRAPYLWEAVRCSPNGTKLASRVWEALRVSEAGRDQRQMLVLAGIAAREGAAEAGAVLEEVFARNCGGGVFDGAEEICQWAGAAGYERVLQSMASSAGTPNEDGEYWLVHSDAREALGEQAADEILADLASRDPRAKEIAAAVSRHAAARPQGPANTKRPSVPYREFRENLVEKTAYVVRQWARGAAHEQILEAARELNATDDEGVFRSLVPVFHVSPYPLDPAVLLRGACSPDWELRRRCVKALSKIRHDDVRAAALEKLGSRRTIAEGAFMLRENYRPEDADELLTVLKRLRREDDFHDVGIDVLHIAEEADHPELVPCLTTVYERTGCSLCRNSAVRDLHRHHSLTPRMVWECMHDSDPDTRKFASGVFGAGSSPTPPSPPA